MSRLRRIDPSRRRRGAASVVLSALLLLLVTAATATTMRGQWAAHQAAEAHRLLQTLHAALDAAESLPADTLAKDIRLPVEETADHSILVSIRHNGDHPPTLEASEYRNDKIIRSVQRPLKRTPQ